MAQSEITENHTGGSCELAPSHDRLVSVVMPCYREPLAVLDRAIDSILDQTYRNLELVLVVDAPHRLEVIACLEKRALEDHRVRVFVNPANLGVWASYSQGVRQARGQMIAIQDADDRSLPQRIEKQVAFLLTNPDVDVVGSALEYVDSDTDASLMVRRYPQEVGREIRRRCPLAHATTMQRTGLYESHGFYDESPDCRHAADYELWCRWFVDGVHMANIPDCLYVYYQSSQNFKTQNVTAILRDTIAIQHAYAVALGYGVLDYCYLFAESVAALLPTRAIVALFYSMTRRRSGRAES